MRDSLDGNEIMSVLVFESVIQRVSYQFTVTGDIIPWVKIFPHISFIDGKIVTAVPLLPSVMLEDTEYPEGVYIGDKIKLYVRRDNQEDVEWAVEIERGENVLGEYIDLSIRNCPICGELLHPSQYGFGTCFNKCCRGQNASSILLFASTLGLTFVDSHRCIFDALLSRGSLSSPADLFRVTSEDISLQGINKLEVQSFLSYIHSIRGRISIGQLLRSINIPNITDREIDVIDAFFQVKQLPVSTFLLLLQNPKLEPTLNLDTIIEFVAHAPNLRLLTELCIILG